uniref:Uncharacterized protein n=1 Tax=Arundo donax TaxID=35708 RepID=A0A0A9EJ99_ARUDO
MTSYDSTCVFLIRLCKFVDKHVLLH